ncbi:MAG: hypothetical protein AAGA43_09500 [Bacteroidota bacterium]
MKAHTVSLINALVLIAFSLWGYLSSDTPSTTALIPAAIGVVLLLLNNGVKKENKVIAHIAVVLTLVVLIGLIKPFFGSLERGDTLAVIRVAIMILTTTIAMLAFIRSFREARKNRQA